MKKVYYNFRPSQFGAPTIPSENPEMYLSLMLEKATPKNSGWFSSMSPHVDAKTKCPMGNFKDTFFANAKKLFSGKISQNKFEKEMSEQGGTVRKCPGILDLFRNSYLVKAPCDIIICAGSEQVIAQPSDLKLMSTEIHGRHQFTSNDSPKFADKINIKFCLPIYASTKGDKSLMFMTLQPQYHNENYDLPLTVLNGIVGPEYLGYKEQININTMVDYPTGDDTVDIFIPKGTVLSYLWFNEPVEFEYDSTITENPVQTKFSRVTRASDFQS